MAIVPRPFPAVLPHGELREVLPDIFLVTGTVALSAPPMRFSRNMTIIRDGERLVLVNSVRLDEAGLAALDKLGKVTDVVRIAGNHGADDPFYADRYKAKTWVVRGQRYTPGFDSTVKDAYFSPDVEMDESTPLPIAGASLHIIGSQPAEALLLLERSDGVCIAGDCFQNITGPDAYFSFLGRIAMRLMGFFKPHNVGPAWLKQCKPPAKDLEAILGRSFTHVLPAHGDFVRGDAKAKYEPAIRRSIAFAQQR